MTDTNGNGAWMLNWRRALGGIAVATNDDPQTGHGVSESLLRAQPDRNGIACSSSAGGPRLAQAMQGLEIKEQTGKLKIVAFDPDQTKQEISDGIIDATMMQRSAQMGVLSIQGTHNILSGKAKLDCAAIAAGVSVVTRENLDSYTA